jgi:glycine/D-amino acid oxidase-like deaminating enzyme
LIFLRQCYPALPEAVRQAESERQASLVFGLAVRNRERLKTIVQQERIACDFSPRGWLYLAHTEREEQALCEEVTLAAQHGQRIELWSRRRIREEFGFNTAYLGRFIPGDGTYHPFKYVCGLLQSALRSGVQLYTRRRVRALVTEASGRVRVVIDDGAILASSVVVATNACSSVGQVSLIDGQPRSASCSMRHAGVLLEMEQAPCARLFAGRSPTALKFLAAVNQGLIAALRGADRRLMRLQGDSKPGSDSDLPGTPDAIPA